MEKAVALMRSHKISELPVIDETGKPVGLLDITDLLSAGVTEEVETKEPPVVRFWNSQSA